MSCQTFGNTGPMIHPNLPGQLHLQQLPQSQKQPDASMGKDKIIPGYL